MSSKRITGCATEEGTQKYKARFSDSVDPGHFRLHDGLWMSSIGMGSYLGESDEATDRLYAEALPTAISLGINVFDSAINYRAQRSERAFGAALETLFASGAYAREELIVSTKGGFLPFDGSYPNDPLAYFKQTYVDTGLLKPEEIAQGCHAMTPSYLENQLTQSLTNLRLETIDTYYLHNPETQLGEIECDEFLRRLSAAFDWLEKKVAEGKIRRYGVATWNAFRVGRDSEEYVSLEELVVLAREAGGPDHHFKVVQLPFNLAMPEAWVLSNQSYGANLVPVLGMAKRLGLTVVGSAALLQAGLLGLFPDALEGYFKNLEKPAQRCLQFARSVPGIATALVGMKNEEHVRENAQAAHVPPLTEQDLILMFQQS
ncbi:MAG: aldo/keto reductase [Candidatus Omnitrophota bacterium]|nr:aldo/keto reductase [Candidatus Omnitrophota bacterium]